jgi:hypothetical protein
VIMAPLESQARTIRSSRRPPPDAGTTRVVISIFGIVVGLAAIEQEWARSARDRLVLQAC